MKAADDPEGPSALLLPLLASGSDHIPDMSGMSLRLADLRVQIVDLGEVFTFDQNRVDHEERAGVLEV